MRLESKAFTTVFISVAVVVLACLGFFDLANASASPYQQAMEKWRQDYQASLTSDKGWLTVAGLFWLHEGENRFGTDPHGDIVLPPGTAPAVAGHFDFHAGKTVVHVNAGVPVTMGGKQVTSAELPPDSQTERLVLGDLVLYVHRSGERFSVRLKDKNSKLRKEFHGLKWFPVNEAYRVTARFVPYDKPRDVEIQTVLGDREHLTVAGYVAFSLSGKEYKLEAQRDDSDGTLSFVFRDLTSVKETYQAARFLDTDPVKDGKVELDFNKAYNPPCAYNPYTTCPLPSPGNRLQVEIPAGEKRYHE
jgi:uncharacterized protein (DUF1684 family)